MAEATSAFEDLAVYQRTRTLINEIYRITRTPSFSRDRALADQIRRAAISILSNIAEGFERCGNSELIHFLYIAKGSSGEVRAQLSIAADEQYIDAPTNDRLQGDCRRISAMLSNFIAFLNRSPLKGAKYAARDLSRGKQTKSNHLRPPIPPNP